MWSSHKNQLICDTKKIFTFTMLRELLGDGGDHRITEFIGLGGIPGDYLVHAPCQTTSCNVLQDLLRGHKFIISFFFFMVGIIQILSAFCLFYLCCRFVFYE